MIQLLEVSGAETPLFTQGYKTQFLRAVVKEPGGQGIRSNLVIAQYQGVFDGNIR